MKYENLAQDILENVGGEENVNSVFNCVTRLRFRLKDEDKANTETLKNMDGVVTVRQSAGQYQVVIGNHVPDVYKALVEVSNLEGEGSVNIDEGDDVEEDTNLFNRFIDVISGIFTPILGVLAASGIIKGMNALFLSLGWLNEAGGTYQILNAVGDALFYFLPVLLGYTAMKKFGGTAFIGIVIGMALVYPNLAGIPEATEPLYVLFEGSLIESPVYIEFLGIPVILMSYSMSVIPIIISTYFAAKLEGFLQKVIPSVVKMFLVPMITLLVIIPLTFIVIGPIATWGSQLIGAASAWLYNLSPIIAGALIGGFWLVFVMFGFHWGLTPISINNIAVSGFDPILALVFVHSFALAAAVLAVWIKTDNQKTKTLSAPAFISAIFGITEPALYGIALPLKRAFIFTLISSGVGGAILGLSNTSMYVFGGLGIFQLPSFFHPQEGLTAGVWGAIIAAIVGSILAFVLTYFFGNINEIEESESAPDPVENNQETENDSGYETPNEAIPEVQSEVITSPIDGIIKNLSDISDAAFSSGALGKGVAIQPSEGKIVSPVAGTVSALFETNHAIGIETSQGGELLIHIGMDTVQLEGKHFTSHVSQGDQIEKGQLLIEFDIKAIQEEGYETITPVVITNYDKYREIVPIEEENSQAGDPLLTLESQ